MMLCLAALRLAASHFAAAINGPAGHPSAECAKNRGNQFRTAWRDDIAQRPGSDRTGNQPGGAIGTAAVIPPILTAIDPSWDESCHSR